MFLANLKFNIFPELPFYFIFARKMTNGGLIFSQKIILWRKMSQDMDMIISGSKLICRCYNKAVFIIIIMIMIIIIVVIIVVVVLNKCMFNV